MNRILVLDQATDPLPQQMARHATLGLDFAFIARHTQDLSLLESLIYQTNTLTESTPTSQYALVSASSNLLNTAGESTVNPQLLALEQHVERRREQIEREREEQTREPTVADLIMESLGYSASNAAASRRVARAITRIQEREREERADKEHRRRCTCEEVSCCYLIS